MLTTKIINSIQRLVLILALSFVVSTSLHAENLIDIYRKALQEDAQYKSARAAFVAAEEKITQGRAGLLPNISLSFVRQVQQVNRGSNPVVTIHNRGITLSGTQPLFRVENFFIYTQSKEEVSKAGADFIFAAQDLILRVSQAYFDVLNAQVDVEVAQAQKEAILRQLEQAKRNFEVGVSTIVDTNEAQARFDLTISQQIAAQNALEISKRALQRIINYAPEHLVDVNEVSTGLLSSLPYSSMDEWVKVAEEKSLVLKSQQSTYEIADQEVKKAWSRHYPTVDLVAQFSDQTGIGASFTGQGIGLTSKSIGIQVNMPVFEGFGTHSRVKEAVANRARAKHDLENTRRTITLQVQQQYLNVTNGIAQVNALKQALKSSKSQLDSTTLGLEVGVRTEVDVLNAQQQFYSAKRDLAKAYHNYLLSRLRLSAEAGELDEITLENINSML